MMVSSSVLVSRMLLEVHRFSVAPLPFVPPRHNVPPEEICECFNATFLFFSLLFFSCLLPFSALWCSVESAKLRWEWHRAPNQSMPAKEIGKCHCSYRGLYNEPLIACDLPFSAPSNLVRYWRSPSSYVEKLKWNPLSVSEKGGVYIPPNVLLWTFLWSWWIFTRVKPRNF
jgi:hypothetical protein